MEKNRKGLCIGSMIIGIISVLMFVIQPIVFIVSVVGIVIGIMGLKSDEGIGMAISGIVLSFIGAIAGILVMTTVLGSFVMLGNPSNNRMDDNRVYHYEKNDENGSRHFEFYIGGGPKDNPQENHEFSPEDKPGPDDNLL